MTAQEMVEWAISVLDSLGHDLEAGAVKNAVARLAHQRAEQLRAMLKELRRDQAAGKWVE